MSIRIKRAYDDATDDDGYRILVDRIWPRGVSKEKAALDAWTKAVSPSTELRKWFGHETERWDEFQRRYQGELDDDEEAQEILSDLRERSSSGVVTLVFAAKDTEHNNAVVLQDLLSSH